MRARFAGLCGLCAVALLLAAPAVRGQGAPPSQLLVLSVIDVKPEMFADFGALQAEAMAAQRKGGQPWRDTWHVATFGHPYRVAVVRPLASFAELDGPSFATRGVGAEQATAINDRARRMIAAQQIYALRARPDLSLGERPAVMRVAAATTVTVAPGRAAEFEAIVKDVVLPAFRKAGEAYLSVSQVVVGGEANQYVALNLYDGMADVDTKGDPVLRGLGADGYAAYRQRLTGIVLAEDRQLLRFNEALSYRAAR